MTISVNSSDIDSMGLSVSWDYCFEECCKQGVCMPCIVVLRSGWNFVRGDCGSFMNPAKGISVMGVFGTLGPVDRERVFL